jgi:Xaa-Pro aminopeptidase
MSGSQYFVNRINRVVEQLQESALSAMFITPGSDLSYLIGYHAVPLERLTMLVVTQNHEPFLIVPRLERSAALASPFGATGWEVISWGESDDPYAIIGDRLNGLSGTIALDGHMWADRVLTIQGRFPDIDCVSAAPIINAIRVIKSLDELDHLREAAAAIDRVHAQVPRFLRAGRTEREVGRDIADLILAEGHSSVDFVIVAAGPNGASPHHEVSDRVIQDGDPVVVDIGGTMPSGYCSDCTRTYSVGEPSPEFLDSYEVLQRAQVLSTQAVRDGARSHDIDAAGRNELTEHGLGEFFIHRTGHGIGLDTHEEPYIGPDNPTVISSGMVFSIEPGFYIEGRYGARIEDIVICTPEGPETLNKQTRDLVVIPSS